jgi:DNA-binding MarR family transcriptional regulator
VDQTNPRQKHDYSTIAAAIIVYAINMAAMDTQTDPFTPPAPAGDALVRALGLMLRKVLQSITWHADRRLAAHDLTHAQWAPLLKIYKGECTTVAALARDMDLDPGAVTRALDRLEAKGLVQRLRSCTDRRVVNLALTEQGTRVASLLPAVLGEVIGAHLAGFERADIDTLYDHLRRMVVNGCALRSAALNETASNAFALVEPAVVEAIANEPNQGARP